MMSDETLQMKDKVVKMFQEDTGIMGRDIADELGVSRQYVAKILHNAGENAMQRQKDVTEARYRKLEKEYVKHYSTDITMTDMAELLGVSPSIVSKISKRTNLRFRSLADERKSKWVKDIAKLRETGKTLQEVADIHDVAISYITRMVKWGREQEEKLKEDIYKKEELRRSLEEYTEDETNVEDGKDERSGNTNEDE